MTGPSFTTKRFTFEGLLAKAISVVPTKDLMPVLKNFLVKVEEGKLTVVATDIELTVVAETSVVDVKETGTVYLRAKALMSIVKEAEEGDLVFTTTDKGVTISVGRASWTLQTMDGDDYPEIPDVASIELHTVNREKFVKGISAVKVAASQDPNRVSFMLVAVSKDGRFRASDAVRLHQIETEEAVGFDFELPSRSVDDLLRMLRSTDLKTIDVGENDEILLFRIGNENLIISKADVTMPDIDSLILKPALANDEEMWVGREELISAIRRVRVTADDTTNAVMLHLKDDVLTVSAQDGFNNVSSETLDVKWGYSERTAVVNHSHFMDLLRSTPANSVQILFGPDQKNRPFPVYLKDEENGISAIISQLRWAA